MPVSFPLWTKPWYKKLSGKPLFGLRGESPWFKWGAVVSGVTISGYTLYKQHSFGKLSKEIDTCSEITVRTLSNFDSFIPLDKLNLMRSPRYQELNLHKDEREKINRHSEQLDNLRKSLSNFDWFPKLTGYMPFFSHGKLSLLNSHKIIEETKLNKATKTVRFADGVSAAIYYLKTRQYDLSERAFKSAKSLLEDDGKGLHAVDLPTFDNATALAHVYNLGAKIVRSKCQYKVSDEYYEKAKSCHADNKEIIASQLALWGDILWHNLKLEKIKPGSSEDLANLKKLLSNTALYNKLKTSLDGYSLGLANLGWLLFWCSRRQERLGLTSKKADWCLREAHLIADEAVSIGDEVSINPHLYRGLIFMDGYKDNVSALQDFKAGLKHYPDHPSLLRRRAMALKNLGKDYEAQEAFLEAAIELRYRINSETGPKIYNIWLKEIEKHEASALENPYTDTKSNKRTNVKNVAEDDDKAFILRELYLRSYDSAYQKLQKLKEQGTTTEWMNKYECWFKRHFNIVLQNNTYDNLSKSFKPLLIPKAREKFLRRLGIDNLPTPYECMALSTVVYDTNKSYDKAHYEVATPSRWRVFLLSEEYFEKRKVLTHGYLAIAFQNEDTGQIVIAHGGTDFTDLKDLTACLKLARGDNPKQLIRAEEFTREVIDKLEQNKQQQNCLDKSLEPDKNSSNSEELDSSLNKKTDKQSNKIQHPSINYEETPTRIYHVGHSLGGYIASYLASTMGPIGSHYAVAFDNPSAWNSINNSATDINQEKLHSDNYINFPVSSYLTRPNFINCVIVPHIGRLYMIQVDVETKTEVPAPIGSAQEIYSMFEDYGLEFIDAPISVISFIKANGDNHCKEQIRAAFDDKIGSLYKCPIYYIISWPKGLKEWLRFEEDTKTLSQNPNTLIPKELDKLKGRNKEQDAAIARIKKSYSLVPAQNPAFQARIPLPSIETELRALLINIKKDKPLTKNQKKLKPYLHNEILSLIDIDTKSGFLLIKNGPLTSWEILHYFRQQLQSACSKEKIAFGMFFYKDLADSHVRKPTLSTSMFFAASQTEKKQEEDLAAQPKSNACRAQI